MARTTRAKLSRKVGKRPAVQSAQAKGRSRAERAKPVAAKTPKPLTRVRLAALASKFAKRKITLDQAPLMELTPRNPYAAAGSMDFWNSNWIASSAIIHLDPRVISGPDHSGRVFFTAPADGTYLIVANFWTVGGNTTLKLTGPWGDSSANASPGVHTAALAMWTATANSRLLCTVTCAGPRRAYIFGFQVYRLS